MKQILTIAVDAELIAVAEQYARSRGVSLSSLVERSFRKMVEEDEQSFTSRWRGKFRAAVRGDDQRYDALAKKYLH